MNPSGDAPRTFIHTHAAQIALQSIDRIVEEEVIGVVIAAPGCGKSECISYWRQKRGQKIRHAWIEADVLTSPRPILNALVEVLGIRFGHNMAETKKLIEQTLARDPIPVFFDEADLLTVRALELLRSIWDQVSALRGANGERGFPLALFGAPRLAQMLDRDDLERLHRRIFHRALLPALAREELRKILATKWPEYSVEDEAVEDLLTRSRGSFGWVNNIMRVATRLCARNGRQITLRTLKATGKHLIGLPEEE